MLTDYNLKIKASFFFMAVGLSTGLAQNANGLVAYYPCNGDFQDASGNNNHAVVTGATPTTDKHGNTSSAYFFDGVDDFATPPTMGPYTSFTLMARIKTATTADKRVFSGLNVLSNLVVSSRLGLYDGIAWRLSLTTVSDNQWHDIAYIFDNGVYSLYVDGTMEYSAAGLSTITDGTISLIGKGNNNSRYFNGSIDDISIYNRALPLEEINALFFRPGLYAGVPPDFIGYWPMSGSAFDLSANNYHGVVNGAVSTVDRFGNEGNAMHFENDDYIHIPSIGNLPVYSFSFWVKIEGAQDSWNVIITYGNRRGGVNFTAGTVNVKGLLRNSSNENLFINNFPLAPDEWHHIVLTVDWATTRQASLYINGARTDGPVTLTGAERSGTGLYLGYEDGHDYFFNGDIDDVIVYNRVLTIDEVSRLYDGSQEEACLWTCNDNTVHTVKSVGIGTDDTRGNSLAVAGGVLIEKIKVATQANWPDYVFNPSYRLDDLDSLIKYITANHKLPDMPSAQEVEESGYDMGEMDAKLLRKIEELMLYLIEQNEQIKRQQKEIDDIRKQLVRGRSVN